MIPGRCFAPSLPPAAVPCLRSPPGAAPPRGRLADRVIVTQLEGFGACSPCRSFRAYGFRASLTVSLCHSFSELPNFTAADVVRVLGVGRVRRMLAA